MIASKDFKTIIWVALFKITLFMILLYIVFIAFWYSIEGKGKKRYGRKGKQKDRTEKTGKRKERKG